ncbi:MAG: 30S ribosomal protein S27ae [Candidatus Nitrosotenuis sp.]
MAGKKAETKATGIAAYYKISGDKVTRTHKICSRCGKGVYMSEHKNRRTCGKCGLTEFIQ